MRAFLLALIVGGLAGCAKPNYLMAPTPPMQMEAPGSKVTVGELHCDAHVQNSNLCVSVAWIALQTKTTFGSFVFKIWRPNALDGSVVMEDPPGSEVKVVLWMPSMGHGSSPPVIVTRLDTGTYRAERVFFTMTGDWEIRFRWALAPNQPSQDAAVVPFTL